MGVGGMLEPLIVVTLLFGGAWINRACGDRLILRTFRQASFDKASTHDEKSGSQMDVGTADKSHRRGRSLSPSLLPSQEDKWRYREVRLLGSVTQIRSPNTAVFRNRFLSRVLHKFPFLVEAWYWALIYWVYQLGRAFTALTIAEGTVNVARKHALQVIALEQKLHIFWELPIQRFFMSYPIFMRGINWLYSFIHIPGTIAFLVWLFYYTVTSNRMVRLGSSQVYESSRGPSCGPDLYAARRRTMAICNLMAFVVFTLWPCMPPRLLSDADVPGEIGEMARSFGFVDTVHGANGAVSVWTANKFCNQWAAMPSLHFGYSLLVGVTIMTIPLAPQYQRVKSLRLPFFNQSHPELAPSIKLVSRQRLVCLLLGFMYPFSILVAIVSTANHFILDAVAGALICYIGWQGNGILLNLLPLEDYFLWCLRMHKPEMIVTDASDNIASEEVDVYADLAFSKV